MELVAFGLDVLQNVAEYMASYRFGQAILRQCDRALWVVEKCARWAVPPPLDQDERHPTELVRPLPWVFFLLMLLTLRVARESISLAFLIMGKPPLRSADVVVFIQSRRRYLRTLKYQGSRMMRSRTTTQPQAAWYSGLMSLFELTMCFRRPTHNYGNNNTTSMTNNDEVVIIKRTKKIRVEEPVVTNETPMERLIEKIMLDLDAESDEDSAITLTDATSPKTDRSECTESDQDTICETSTPVRSQDTEISQTNGDDIHFSPNKNKHSSSTPEKQENSTESQNVDNDTGNQTFQTSYGEIDKTVTENSSKSEEKRKLEENITESAFANEHTNQNNENTKSVHTSVEDEKISQDSAVEENTLSPSQESDNFIKSEASFSRKTPKKEHRFANGRTAKSVPSKKKGTNHQQRQSSNEALSERVLPSHSSF